MFLEGLRLTAYQDSKGVWTIGHGHTGPEVKRGLSIDRQKASALFRGDVAWAEDAVRKRISLSLNPDQFDALVMLTYNIGASGFAGSTVLRKVNEGALLEAGNAFLMWNKSGGKPVLESRRYLERALFLKSIA